MSMLFLKWEEDTMGVPQALFRGGGRIIAFSRAELAGPLACLYNMEWRAAVMTALAAHPVSLATGNTGSCASADL